MVGMGIHVFRYFVCPLKGLYMEYWRKINQPSVSLRSDLQKRLPICQQASSTRYPLGELSEVDNICSRRSFVYSFPRQFKHLILLCFQSVLLREKQTCLKWHRDAVCLECAQCSLNNGGEVLLVCFDLLLFTVDVDQSLIILKGNMQ